GIVSKYRPRAAGDHPVRSCIIEVNATAVGYIQYYPVEAYEGMSKWLEDPAGAWAMDFFVGEPDLWGQGVGSRSIGLVKRYLFDVVDVRRVVSDPREVNARSIAACQKAGLARGRSLPGHETHEGETWDCVLMEATG
ncbi:MAG: GNAT family N-acetyltransferase, partial [Planctomycetota bacterium]